MEEARFLEEVRTLGVSGWTPPGKYEPRVGVWVTHDEVFSSFPETGVEIFSSVDLKSFWFDHRNEVIADVIISDLAQDLPFVEIGSGSGVVIDYLRRTSNRPLASIEPIPAGAIAVAMRGVELSFCGDLESLQLPSGSLSAIGAFDVIEHLEDPQAFLREFHRVMREDGLLIVTVPAYQWLWSDFDVWNGHVQRFTLSSLSALLQEVGFEPVRGTYLFAPLVLPAFLTRRVLGKLRKPRGDRAIEVELEESLAPSSPLVDRVLRSLHRIERLALRRMRIPFGTSILMTAKPRSA